MYGNDYTYTYVTQFTAAMYIYNILCTIAAIPIIDGCT